MNNQICFLREQANLTQQQLADKAGWTQGRWSSYETGDRSPRPDVVIEIINAFAALGINTSFEELFSDPNIPSQEKGEAA